MFPVVCRRTALCTPVVGMYNVWDAQCLWYSVQQLHGACVLDSVSETPAHAFTRACLMGCEHWVPTRSVSQGLSCKHSFGVYGDMAV
jgi:hypothetical protein